MNELTPKGTYPNNIAVEIKKRNLEIKDVIYNSNLSRTLFESLLHGKRTLNQAWRRRLANAIGCKPSDLTVKSEPVAQPALPVNEGFHFVLSPNEMFDFTKAETETLVEIVERERNFMLSTARNIAARNLELILVKLKSQLGSSVPNEKPAAWVNWSPANSPKLQTKVATQTKPAKKTQIQVARKLSRPWGSHEALADALSALKNGMSNQEVADKTNRPLSDITTTKVLFGWMWKSNAPAQPSQREVMASFHNIKDSTKQLMFELAS